MLDGFTLTGLAVVALCLGGIFVCSLAEAAMLGVTDSGRRRLAESRDPRALRVARLLASGDYLSAVIVAMNTFLIVLSTVMTLIVHHHLGEGQEGEHTAEFLHFGIVLFVLIFAELTPKTYGGLYPERVAQSLSSLVTAMVRLFRPLVAVLTQVSRPLTGRLDTVSHHSQLLTVEEIRMAADVSEEEGMVEPGEAEMLDNVMDLGETQVKEIMVPRVAMVAAPEELSPTEFAAVARDSGFSRIPIYRETVDTITGIVYVKDLLKHFHENGGEFALAEIARKPLYFPETKRIDDLLRELREQRVHIGVVVDEFGGTAGLVTIEDVLEELVGDIRDEHDRPSDEVQQVSERELLVDGWVRIAEVNELLAIELPEDQYETVAGLACGLAGRIPAIGETFVVQGVRLTIEDSDEQHVARVRVVAAQREDGDG